MNPSGPDLLAWQCRVSGLIVPEREYRFDTTRRWRLDCAWPALKLGVEIDGGAFSGGRHTRGAGFIKDMAKHNALVLAGWRLLRFTPQQVVEGLALTVVQRAVEGP